ncbi:MAG: diguanylate cyclase [Proteobacteria bacterium]|nr:diguanylate cyclase [Pseudomonadota bacterium]
MRQILLVEGSNMFGRLAKAKIEKFFDIPVFWTKTLAETEKLLAMAKGNFSMALLDFDLPDAPNGEVIDRVIAEGITTFVFTAELNDEVRNSVWSKKVADYILKEDPNSIDYIIAAMRQLAENQESLVLVVGDSADYRTLVSELLYVRKFRVLNATDGKSALEILSQHPEVKLVITDFVMPGMDGCTLCQKIREKYRHDRLAIIGFAAKNEGNIGARFIKSGANDFIIRQSFLVEEFYCRVNHCMETLSLIGKIREGANRDFLTGLYSRRYFFDAGSELLRRCRESGERLACIMLDIDFFKKVNDTFGHDVGDLVIKNMARMLREDSGNRDIVARIGGEEFCILSPGGTKREVVARFEKLRRKIKETPATKLQDKRPLFISTSIGICSEIGDSLERMMKIADECLYKAKEGGRNRVEAWEPLGNN